jgi:prevent-host-death family protein
MSSHSVADARNHLSELIDRALQGQDVVITRHGAPVVELRPVSRPARPVSLADLEWLDARRLRGLAIGEDAGATLSRIRDEDWS